MILRPTLAVVCLGVLFTVTMAPAWADPPGKLDLAKPVLKRPEVVKVDVSKPNVAQPDQVQGAAPKADALPAAEHPVPGAAEVRAGLAEGFKIGSKNMPSAQSKFDAARRLSANDPRIDFAEGLAWAKQVQWGRAQDQFERALRRPGAPYWPAWQAWIWSAFRERQTDTGFLRLLEMAKTLAGGRKPGQPPASAEVDLAKWMGRVMSAAARSETSSKGSEAWARTIAQLEIDLGPELFKGVEAGRVEFFNEQQQILKQSQVKVEEKVKQGKQQVQVEQAQVEGSLVKAAKEKAEAKRSAADWKKWLETETAKVDKELARLEKDYRFGQQQVESLTESISLVGREMTVLSQNEPARGTALRGNWETQYLNRQFQLNQYQNEFNFQTVGLSELARQGTLLVGQRATMVRQYEQATGTLLEKTADLDKWSTRLSDKKAKLQVKALKPVAGKTVTSFSGYLPLNLEVERDRLLRDLGLTIAAP